jgi:hypothetical protein
MPDETTVDTAGVTRTAEGQISDGQTTQVDQSPSSTTPETTESGKTLLTEDKSPDASKTSDDKPTASDGAPEKYSDYTLPDGFTLDPAVKTEADALFKGLGLDQKQAQSLVDFYGKQISELSSAPAKAYQEMTDGWRKDSESHPDLRGKLGPGQEINVRISKALDGLGDPKLASDFKAAMDLTGVGNHPAFIRVISRLAEKVTEGTHVAGNGPSKEGQSQSGRTAPPSAAAAMWPTLPSSTRQ